MTIQIYYNLGFSGCDIPLYRTGNSEIYMNIDAQTGRAVTVLLVPRKVSIELVENIQLI